MRDAERDLIFNEYKDRKGELIRGIVRRFEKGNNIVVDVGRTEGILPFREQTPRETYRPGDRIVAYLFEVPHRFAMGLMLGWLRHRTGSLAPCVLAHALHNGVVMGIWG